MSLTTTRCHVSHQPVTCVTDLEGCVVRVICDAFEEAGGVCRIKRGVDRGGPLAQLLDRVEEQTLDTRNIRCDLL